MGTESDKVQRSVNLRVGDTVGEGISPPLSNIDSFTLSSYTGQDIKVVVHVPDLEGLERAKVRIKELELEGDASSEFRSIETDRISLLNRQIISKRNDIKANKLRIASLTQIHASPNSGSPRTYPLSDSSTNATEAANIISQLIENNASLERDIDALNEKIAGSNAERFEIGQDKLELQREKKQLEDLLKTFRSTKVLADLQTLSFQVFRDKVPVRALGHAYPKSYTRGSRTIAGTMVFTIFNQDVLMDILGTGNTFDYEHNKFTTQLLDQIPPLDLTIVFVNELGQESIMNIYGVEFDSNSMVMGVEDMMIESVVSFVARDIDPMRDARHVANNKIIGPRETLTDGTQVWKDSPDYKRMKERFNPFK